MAFEAGDIVRCIMGKKGVSGMGWENGLIFKIKRIDRYSSGDCCFEGKNKCGVFAEWLELTDTTSTARKFKVGDTVRNISTRGFNTNYHRIGTVVSIVDHRYTYKIKYRDSSNVQGDDNDYELITKKTGIMNKITAKIKRIFSSSLQIQYKAGLINDCGELTDEGITEQEELIRADYDEKMTERAKEIIAEEKEDK